MDEYLDAKKESILSKLDVAIYLIRKYAKGNKEIIDLLKDVEKEVKEY